MQFRDCRTESGQLDHDYERQVRKFFEVAPIMNVRPNSIGEATKKAMNVFPGIKDFKE